MTVKTTSKTEIKLENKRTIEPAGNTGSERAKSRPRKEQVEKDRRDGIVLVTRTLMDKSNDY